MVGSLPTHGKTACSRERSPEELCPRLLLSEWPRLPQAERTLSGESVASVRAPSCDRVPDLSQRHSWLSFETSSTGKSPEKEDQISMVSQAWREQNHFPPKVQTLQTGFDPPTHTEPCPCSPRELSTSRTWQPVIHISLPWLRLRSRIPRWQ